MSASTDWLSATAALIGAIGTVSAVLIVLFSPLVKRPKLSIELQRHGQQSGGGAYWHGTTFTPPSSGSVANSVVMQQLRVWVVNDGREAARNCRVKLKIVEPQLGGRDSPIEFTLPAFLYYKPGLGASGLLRAPEPAQVSVDIAAHSQEAFELLFHRVGTQECYPYSLHHFSPECRNQVSLEGEGLLRRRISERGEDIYVPMERNGWWPPGRDHFWRNFIGRKWPHDRPSRLHSETLLLQVYSVDNSGELCLHVGAA